MSYTTDIFCTLYIHLDISIWIYNHISIHPFGYITLYIHLNADSRYRENPEQWTDLQKRSSELEKIAGCYQGRKQARKGRSCTRLPEIYFKDLCQNSPSNPFDWVGAHHTVTNSLFIRLLLSVSVAKQKNSKHMHKLNRHPNSTNIQSNLNDIH